ncbi:hypothetical protein TNCV_2113651 [Trichonephila clavipes]|nr:hypothetical protein TNCV_2113651 [Trichonephila clavipes]
MKKSKAEVPIAVRHCRKMRGFVLHAMSIYICLLDCIAALLPVLPIYHLQITSGRWLEDATRRYTKSALVKRRGIVNYHISTRHQKLPSLNSTV